MNEIPVEIISPTEAKEVNPIKRPIKGIQAFGHPNPHSYLFEEWQKAEFNRRVFKIIHTISNDPDMPHKVKFFDYLKTDKYAIGSIHTAECNLEDLTAIIL